MGVYCYITGYLARDPETRQVAGGKEVTRLTIGCSPGVAKEKEDDYETYFVDVSVWAPANKYVRDYAHKGDLLGVQGELAARKYTDREGAARIQHELLRAQTPQILSRKADREAGAGNRTARPPAPAREPASASVFDDENIDEIPF